MTVMRTERPLGELFSELSQATSLLFQKEVQLAKVEMSQKASEAGKQVGFVVAGGAVAYAGLLALVAAAILGLAVLVPAWLAALIVGLVVAGVGYAVLQKGLNDLKQMNPAPEKTLQTLKEDGQWLKHHLS